MKDAHTRIIWGITWSHDDAFFATASREKLKSVKVWKGTMDDIGTLSSELPEQNSATAIRFFPRLLKESYAIVVGLESGDMNFWSNNNGKEWTKIYSIPEPYAHCSAVRRVKFR